jgi:hypothetical protein
MLNFYLEEGGSKFRLNATNCWHFETFGLKKEMASCSETSAIFPFLQGAILGS